MDCVVCGSPMQDLRPIKAATGYPLPASLPDWLCVIAPDGSHADPDAFPAWWLATLNAS